MPRTSKPSNGSMTPAKPRRLPIRRPNGETVTDDLIAKRAYDRKARLFAEVAATAQQTLANAQASYQKQVLAANDTRQAYADAVRSPDPPGTECHP